MAAIDVSITNRPLGVSTYRPNRNHSTICQADGIWLFKVVPNTAFLSDNEIDALGGEIIGAINAHEDLRTALVECAHYFADLNKHGAIGASRVCELHTRVTKALVLADAVRFAPRVAEPAL